MRRTDIIISLVIGEAAAILMLLIGRNLALPPALGRVLPLLPLIFPFFTLLVIILGSLMGRVRLGFYQLSKFGLVGGLNFLIDLGVLNLMLAAFGVTTGFYAVVSKAAAFIAALTSSFVWNKFWTFHSLSTDSVGLQFVEFFTVSAVGLGINVGAFALMNNIIGPQAGIDGGIWANIAAASAAVAGFLWNFIGYKFFVFRRPGR